MLKRSQLGKRYLRESDGKITEDDIRDYIYGVAQSTFDNLDFEIDYAITHNHWNDLDLIEDGEVDAEMLSVRVELNDDYAIKYKAIENWVREEHYDTDDFDMYAYVSKDFVLANINGEDIGENGYEYETIEFMFGNGGSMKNVYMNDGLKITQEIYTRLEQELKSRGIYDLVGQPKVELNESRSKINKRRNMIRESNYILPNQKDILNGADDVASGFVYLMEDMLKSSSYDYEDGDEMYFTLGYASSARSNEIDEFFEENGVYDISVKTYPSDKKGKTFFHDTTFESSEFTENFSGGLTFDELKRKIVAGIMKHLEKKLGAYFPESSSKSLKSKRKMVESKRLAKRKVLRENKERPTKKDIEEAIYNLAVSLASDLTSGSFDKDENTLYKGATVWAKDEVENEYILDWLEYNGYDSINANVAGTYEYKDEYFEIQVGDRDYYPCHYFMDGEEDYQGFIESIEEDLTREFTNYNDIFELLNDEYYDDFYGESRKCKRVARKSLRESKRGFITRGAKR